MNRVLFISGLYPKELEALFKDQSKSKSIQNAPNVFQWAVLRGLEENEVDYYVHSYPFLSSYPLRNTCMKVVGAPIMVDGKQVGDSFSYYNLMYFKERSIKNRVYSETKKWLSRNSSSKNAIVLYSTTSYMVEPLVQLKNEFNFSLCVIVTDLIEDALNFTINQHMLKRVQVAIEKRKQRRLFSRIDKYVLLSKHMEERIPEAIGRSIVVEGIANIHDDRLQVSKLDNNDTKVLLYSGSLHPFSGIRNLVDSFINTRDEHFRLYICGIGDEETYIKEKQLLDSRILFLGNLHREKARMLQYQAHALVNPRKPNGGITKYSFPSKTIEYLSSGTPMIGYHLEGLPDDYLPYIIMPSDFSIEAMSNTIENTLCLPKEELERKGQLARDFIRNNKTSKIQVGRILRFIFDE